MLFARSYRLLFILLFTSFIAPVWAKSSSQSMDDWFRNFKQTASPQALYQFLYQMPKGGDLHHHLSGSGYGKWWFELAADSEKNGGYSYYTRVKNNNCEPYGVNTFSINAVTFLFHTISQHTWSELSACRQQEYRALSQLNEAQIQGFIQSLELDKPYEGQDEFFERHWQRLNELIANPHIMANILLRNMQEYQQENLLYLETQQNLRFMKRPDGSFYSEDEALAIFTTMLSSAEAKLTGVTVKFQYALVRFTPNTDAQLKWIYAFVDNHRDYYVGINLVGREDDPKGHPLNFLSTLRSLRTRYPKINLAFHAGESVSPSENIRDTLLLGVDRIGHGINLLSDPDTYLLMRNNRYLIETNLISNFKLEYIQDFSQHPFPQYLRTGIPTALSTDDRGMWDARLTDEFYVAVTQFNLSWQELKLLSRNSLAFSFLAKDDKQRLLQTLEDNFARFEQGYLNNTGQKKVISYSGFMCSYEPLLCAQGGQ